jgi:hypothetical protein
MLRPANRLLLLPPLLLLLLIVTRCWCDRQRIADCEARDCPPPAHAHG